MPQDLGRFFPVQDSPTPVKVFGDDIRSIHFIAYATSLLLNDPDFSKKPNALKRSQITLLYVSLDNQCQQIKRIFNSQGFTNKTIKTITPAYRRDAVMRIAQGLKDIKVCTRVRKNKSITVHQLGRAFSILTNATDINF